MQQAYPEANTELVEQVSKMTSKHEKERAREEPDMVTSGRTRRLAGTCAGTFWLLIRGTVSC